MNGRSVVVYESMFGNTRRIAEAIAEGMGTQAVPVGELGAEFADAALAVVGAPTHVWHLPSARTRKAAIDGAAKNRGGPTTEPRAAGTGVREWLTAPSPRPGAVIAFDTRSKAPRLLTGSAARHIARLARRSGIPVVCAPRSFFVSKANALLDGQLELARAFGAEIAQNSAKSAHGKA